MSYSKEEDKKTPHEVCISLKNKANEICFRTESLKESKRFRYDVRRAIYNEHRILEIENFIIVPDTIAYCYYRPVN